MNTIYIFSDWTNTVNLIENKNDFDKEKFNKFFASLQVMEEKTNCKVKFFIVSGCSIESAKKRYKLFKSAFKSVDREDMFMGIAFEYGGFYIDNNESVINICNGFTNIQKDIIENFAKKYDFYPNKEYKLYLSFEASRQKEDRFEQFYKDIKANFPQLSYVYFNDEYGYGFDIKPKNVLKKSFVEWIVKKDSSIKTIVAIGDDEEDVQMVNIKGCSQNKYFIGFRDKQYSSKVDIISQEKNIDGASSSLCKLADII